MRSEAISFWPSPGATRNLSSSQAALGFLLPLEMENSSEAPQLILGIAEEPLGIDATSHWNVLICWYGNSCQVPVDHMATLPVMKRSTVLCGFGGGATLYFQIRSWLNCMAFPKPGFRTSILLKFGVS